MIRILILTVLISCFFGCSYDKSQKRVVFITTKNVEQKSEPVVHTQVVEKTLVVYVEKEQDNKTAETKSVDTQVETDGQNHKKSCNCSKCDWHNLDPQCNGGKTCDCRTCYVKRGGSYAHLVGYESEYTQPKAMASLSTNEDKSVKTLPEPKPNLKPVQKPQTTFVHEIVNRWVWGLEFTVDFADAEDVNLRLLLIMVYMILNVILVVFSKRFLCVIFAKLKLNINLFLGGFVLDTPAKSEAIDHRPTKTDFAKK